MLRFVNILLVCFFILLPSIFCQTANNLKAVVDKNKVETGEIFTYKITVEGEFINPQLDIPALKDFAIIAQGQSRNYTTKGDKTVITLNINYQLMAVKPGTFTIDAVALKDQSQQLKSIPLRIEVSGKPLQDKQKLLPYLENATEI